MHLREKLLRILHSIQFYLKYLFIFNLNYKNIKYSFILT